MKKLLDKYFVIHLTDFPGTLLKSFDPDVRKSGKSFPTGEIVGTNRLEEAMRFESAGKALDLWNTTSKVTPVRPDGEPNKPMTVLSIEVIEVSAYKKTLQ